MFFFCPVSNLWKHCRHQKNGLQNILPHYNVTAKKKKKRLRDAKNSVSGYALICVMTANRDIYYTILNVYRGLKNTSTVQN